MALNLGEEEMEQLFKHSDDFDQGMGRIRKAEIVVAQDGSGDTTNVQDGINFLTSTIGGIVYIREGTYNISTPLVFGSNIEIIGSGYATNIYLTTGNAIAPSSSKIIMRDMRFTCSGTASKFMDVTSLTDSIFENLWIEMKTDAAGMAKLTTCTNVLFSKCKFLVTSALITNSGLDIRSSTNIKVLGCTFVGVGHGWGIQLQDSTDCLIANNYITTMSDGYGVWVYGVATGTNCSVINNIIYDCSIGIRISVFGGGTINKTIVVGNNIRSCATGIADGGTATELGHNITA